MKKFSNQKELLKKTQHDLSEENEKLILARDERLDSARNQVKGYQKKIENNLKQEYESQLTETQKEFRARKNLIEQRTESFCKTISTCLSELQQKLKGLRIRFKIVSDLNDNLEKDENLIFSNSLQKIESIHQKKINFKKEQIKKEIQAFKSSAEKNQDEMLRKFEDEYNNLVRSDKERKSELLFGFNQQLSSFQNLCSDVEKNLDQMKKFILRNSKQFDLRMKQIQKNS